MNRTLVHFQRYWMIECESPLYIFSLTFFSQCTTFQCVFPFVRITFPSCQHCPSVSCWATDCSLHFLSHRCGEIFDLTYKFPAPPGKLAGCQAAAGCFKQLLFPRHTSLHLQLHYFIHTSFPPFVSSFSYQKALAMEPCRNNYHAIYNFSFWLIEE